MQERNPPSRDRWLTYEEEEKLFTASPRWLKEIIIFAVETGGRREENPFSSCAFREVEMDRKDYLLFRAINYREFWSQGDTDPV